MAKKISRIIYDVYDDEESLIILFDDLKENRFPEYRLRSVEYKFPSTSGITSDENECPRNPIFILVLLKSRSTDKLEVRGQTAICF